MLLCIMTLDHLGLRDGSHHDGHVLAWQVHETALELRKTWLRPVRGAWFTAKLY